LTVWCLAFFGTQCSSSFYFLGRIAALARCGLLIHIHGVAWSVGLFVGCDHEPCEKWLNLSRCRLGCGL